MFRLLLTRKGCVICFIHLGFLSAFQDLLAGTITLESLLMPVVFALMAWFAFQGQRVVLWVMTLIMLFLGVSLIGNTLTGLFNGTCPKGLVAAGANISLGTWAVFSATVLHRELRSGKGEA